MGFTRTQPFYDSVQIHTGITAGTEASFFTTALNQQANQITTGTDTPYRKTDYHTNIKLNQTEKGQELLIKGIKIYLDIPDIVINKQIFYDSNACLYIYKQDEKLLQTNLIELSNFKNIIGTATSSWNSSTLVGERRGFLFTDNTYTMFDYGLKIKELETYKVVIKFFKGITIKTFNDVDGTYTADDIIYTQPFNLFVSLLTEETRK